jgi:hypothetical protein
MRGRVLHIGMKDAAQHTFSETRLLLPFNSSGAIQGSVPLTPPEINVWHLTLDRPKSPTYKHKMVIDISKVSMSAFWCKQGARIRILSAIVVRIV